MIRLLLITTLLLLASNLTKAQSLLLGIEIGPTFGLAPRSSHDLSFIDLPQGARKRELQHYSFGDGRQWSIYGGYAFNEHFSILLGLSHHKGDNQLIDQLIQYDVMRMDSSMEHQRLKVLRIDPKLRFSWPMKRWRLSFSTGASFAIEGQRLKEYRSNTTKFTNLLTSKATDRLAIGWDNDIRIDYSITSNTRISLSFQSYFQTFSADRANVTSYIRRNKEAIGELSTFGRNSVYQEAIFINRPPNLNQPSKNLRTYNPASSFGLLLGLEHRFDSQKSNHSTPQSTTPSPPTHQPHWYASFNVGYGLDLMPENHREGNFTWDTEQPENHRRRNATGSYGAGWNMGLSIGYTFNNFIALELQGSYLHGSTTTITLQDVGDDPITSYHFARMFRLIPSLRLSAPLSKGLLYLSTGWIIGLQPTIIQQPHTTERYFAEWQFTGGQSFGLMNELGFQWPISPRCALFCSIKAFAQSYAPTQSELVKETVGGKDILSNKNIIDRQYRYEPFAIQQGTSSDPNEPFVSPKEYYSFSSVGMNIGMTYRFQK